MGVAFVAFGLCLGTTLGTVSELLVMLKNAWMSLNLALPTAAPPPPRRRGRPRKIHCTNFFGNHHDLTSDHHLHNKYKISKNLQKEMGSGRDSNAGPLASMFRVWP